VSANKPNINDHERKLNNDDYPVFVSSDVENNPIVSNKTSTGIDDLDIIGRFPISILNIRKP
jgi:hypothetical protein